MGSSLDSLRRRVQVGKPGVARTWRRVKGRVHGMLGDHEFERHALVGPGRFWREIRSWQISFLRETGGLLPGHRFLDVGCGTLRGGIPIIKYLDANHYWGLEVRPHVLEEARRELARYPNAAAKEPCLILSEGFPTLRDFSPIDRVWGFAVLIHMDDPVAQQCFEYVSRVLRPDGVFFANVRLGDRAEANGGAGFHVVTRPAEFYSDLARRTGLGMQDLGTLASLGHDFGLGGDAHHLLRFARRD